MKPRNDRWWWLKETVCYFWGHRWKCSWRHRADRDYVMSLDYHRTDKDKVPYARRQSGNPLCEYSEGWHFKCRRCRTRTRDDSWQPWWRDLFGAVRQFWSCWWIGVTVYWPRGKKWPGANRSWWVWIQRVLVGAPLFAFGQAYCGWAYERRWPFFPGSIALDLDYRLSMYLERWRKHE